MDDINQGLRQVVDHALDLDELAAFDNKMMGLARLLVKNGAERFELTESSMKLHTSACIVDIETPDDEWEFRKLLLGKSTVVNTGQVDLLP